MRIKTIIFDLDDTLLWDHKSVAVAFNNTCQKISTYYALDPKALETAVREQAKKLYSSYDTYDYAMQIGINPFEGLWGDFDDPTESNLKAIASTYRKEAWTKGLAELGIEDEKLGAELAELFREERIKNPIVYADTFEVLERLESNYQLVLLTNGAPSLQQKKLAMTPELAPFFDHMFISGSFGKGKPARELFEHVLQKIGATSENAIMIGDNIMTDILGASRVGMRSVWVNREGKERNLEIQPTYEIPSLSELLPLLFQVNEEKFLD